jgi:hypothetical protein
MFDLNLAHIHSAERERDLTADLRDRRILKIAAQTAGPTPSAPRQATAPRPAARTRAYGHGR